ncbi:MAG: hypothetical protein J0J10_26190, partial [Bosea sp.]|uniref:hypothetical protein n=1 Tax=Bosea sp. (in: a-proteobacteria) TaxID=1871050 RepID=UPI001AD3BE7F
MSSRRSARTRWRASPAGDVFTQVGADTLARVAVGLNILTMADIGVMPVSAGEYLGWFGPSLVRTAGSNLGGPGLYNSGSGTGNLSTFTDATLDTAARAEIAFTVGKPTVSEPRLRKVETGIDQILVALRESLSDYSPGLALVNHEGFWIDASDKRTL